MQFCLRTSLLSIWIASNWEWNHKITHCLSLSDYFDFKKGKNTVKLQCTCRLSTKLMNCYAIIHHSSAINEKTKEKVAIKKLHRPFQSEIFAKRAYRELRLLKHMKHENVSRVNPILLLPSFIIFMTVCCKYSFFSMFCIRHFLLSFQPGDRTSWRAYSCLRSG